jgi:peptidoglycan hydrolase-like protein with peptidoglycan-binding domain
MARGTSLAGVARCKRTTRIAIGTAIRHVAGVAMNGKDVQMRLREMAVAIAALTLAGTVVAAGNDTSTSTSGMTNGSSSGQTSSSQSGASANDQSGPQAGASSSDQTAAPQAGSSQTGTSPSASASGEQNDPALVRSAQQALKQKGFDAGAVDGQMGPSTESALRNFQQAQGLPQSGNLDQQTLAALGVNQDQSSAAAQGSSQSSMSGQGSQSQASQSPGSMSNHGTATQTSGSYK